MAIDAASFYEALLNTCSACRVSLNWSPISSNQGRVTPVGLCEFCATRETHLPGTRPRALSAKESAAHATPGLDALRAEKHADRVAEAKLNIAADAARSAARTADVKAATERDREARLVAKETVSETQARHLREGR